MDITKCTRNTKVLDNDAMDKVSKVEGERSVAVALDSAPRVERIASKNKESSLL